MALKPEEKAEFIDAIYQAQVKQARELVDKIDFDAQDLPHLFRRLKGESETAQILVFSSYLEDRVQTLIKSRLQHMDSTKIDKGIFGSNGPLSTFGNQISLSYQLGWITPAQKRKLDAFKKVRNEFAHNAFNVKLSDQKITAYFRIIDYGLHEYLVPIRQIFTSKGKPDPFLPNEQITKEVEFFCNLALLAHKTFADLLLLPIPRESGRYSFRCRKRPPSCVSGHTLAFPRNCLAT